jgi:hypothetical protein
MLPPNLTTIEAGAFRECWINTITLPPSLTAIEADAFAGSSLLEIDLSHTGLTKIAASTFQGCGQLQKVKLPDSVTVIEERAFGYCPALTDINIPANIQSIGALSADSENGGYAFGECEELYNLTIPDSVTNIKFFKKEARWSGDDDAEMTDFKGCGKLPIATRKRLQELGYTGEF